MKYRLQYYPNGDIVTIHVDQRASNKRIACGEGFCAFDMKTEEALKKGPSLVKALLNIRGVILVELDNYEIKLEKGAVFEWDDILGKALVIIRVELDPKGELKESAPPRKPSQAYLKSIQKKGSDIDDEWLHQCPIDDDGL